MQRRLTSLVSFSGCCTLRLLFGSACGLWHEGNGKSSERHLGIAIGNTLYSAWLVLRAPCGMVQVYTGLPRPYRGRTRSKFTYDSLVCRGGAHPSRGLGIAHWSRRSRGGVNALSRAHSARRAGGLKHPRPRARPREPSAHTPCTLTASSP